MRVVGGSEPLYTRGSRGYSSRRDVAMKKQELLAIVEQLPEDFDPESLMHKLYLRAKLERAEQAIQRGDVLSHEEVVARSQ